MNKVSAETAKAVIEVLEGFLSDAKNQLDHQQKCGQPFTIRNNDDQKALIGFLRSKIHTLYSVWLREYQEEQSEIKEKEND